MKINEPIAIVGMGGVFPKASTVRDFWKNILERVDCIEDITTRDELSYWRPEDYLGPQPFKNNKTYARKAGFVPKIEFDASRFGIPPKSLEALSSTQLYALYVADQTLTDARLTIEETTPEQRARVSVILGVGGVGNTGVEIAKRAAIPDWARVLRQSGLPEEAVQAILSELSALYAEWQESTFPGYLSNVVTGRIANRFDLGGSNFTVDAACAASLAALKVSVGELLDGSCDAVLTGGVNIENSIVSFLSFSRLGALSRQEECHPFGVKADGLVIGDCGAMLVLKRLSDAERDGDRIYALIRGIGSSSDGRAKSIYAPRFEGQVKAVERAYADSGISPAEISYVEAHGTGTPVGDPIELQSLSGVFDRYEIRRQSVPLSSVKSQVGHARIAAGVASTIKVALALHHKVLPPMIHADAPIPQLKDSAFYLNPTSRPWIRGSESTSRKAAINSFGFGGTNFHVILEEYDRQNGPYRLGPAPISLFLHAPTREALIQEAQRIHAESSSAEGENVIRAYVATIDQQEILPDHPRLACVAPDLAALRDNLSEAIDYLTSHTNTDQWESPRGTYFRARSLENGGKTVALFSGQGAQYPNMGLELALNFPEFQEVLAQFDSERQRQGLNAISDVLYPVSVSAQEQITLQREALTATVNAQPALGAVSWGMYLLLTRAGFKADFAVGHSYGELPALGCGGAFSQADFVRLSVARGKLMSRQLESGAAAAGKMLAVKAPSSEVDRILAEAGHEGLYLTNHNSALQTVVAGRSELVDRFQSELQSRGIAAIAIPVSGAFHTPDFEAARTEFQAEIDQTTFQPLKLPVLSNATGKPYVDSSSTNQSLLGQQMVVPVLFRQSIERAFEEGARLFVEIGCGSILSDFVRDTLAGKEYFSVALHPKKGLPADLQYWNGLAKLKVFGLPVSIVDPYFEPSRAPRVGNGKSLNFTLDGGLYLSAKNRRARERALNEPKPLPPGLSTNSSGVQLQSPSDEVAPAFDPNPSDSSLLPMQTTPTNELSHLHSKFIECQSEFLKLVASKLDAYAAASQRSNGHQSPDLAAISYQETLAMLDRAQTAFHQTHREYLNSQNEIERLIDPEQPVRPVDWQNRAPVLPVRPQTRGESSGNGGNGHPSGIGGNGHPSGNGDPVRTLRTSRLDESAARPAAPVQVDDSKPVLESKSIVKVGRETITTKLIQVVSETTGYAKESINLAMDLESDLGVDSIMKVEILAGLSKDFPEIKLEQLDVSMPIRTLDDIVEALSSLVQQPAGSVAAPTSPTRSNELTTSNQLASNSSAVEQRTAFDLEQLKEAILEVVLETGYPKEMIGLDMDLEADLGLDSIRKLEILAKIQEFITVPDVNYAAVTNIRTINQILEFAKSLESAATPAAVQKPESNPITRFRATLKRAPVIERGFRNITGQWAIVCQDPADPFAEQILQQLTEGGQTAVRLSLGELNTGLDQAGQIGGIVILAPKPSVLSAPIDGFREADYAFLKAVFALAAKWNKPEDGLFISVSRLGGTLGLSHENSLSFMPAGLSGLTKSLSREWPGIYCRHIDLDPEMSESEAASAVLEEAFDADPNLAEVGRTRRGQRWRIDLQPEPISDVGSLESADSKDELLLVTGGARGITAECIVGLSSKFAGKVVLLGRTALDTKEPAWANGEQSSEQLHERALGFLAQNHPNPTPIQAKRLVGELISRRQARETLDRIRANGVECAYYAVDVTDSNSMAEVLRNVQQQYGPVTSIVHGAGNIADKRIGQKVEKDFAAVVDTKVKGLENVLRHVDLTKLRRMLLFSSISSVFGNAGQTDYALANEVLNKFAVSFSLLHPEVKTVAICWGPWDSGMMNETLKRLYEARGIKLISQSVGTDFFIREFLEKNTEAGQIVISGQMPLEIGKAKPMLAVAS
jgi:acyl transferase domain-containing protein/NAD(P)-dependent dehydrogenase (short-subunit alcohol dehydrogenase family)/acyl carrier protein